MIRTGQWIPEEIEIPEEYKPSLMELVNCNQAVIDEFDEVSNED